MPTVKQIGNSKKKLRATPRPKGNKPKLPNRLTYIIITADPKTKRDKAFLKTVREHMNGRK